ncbi:hypothetical protein COCMIDRAFT_37946 [Bipolaris oryzae ATCC 44560]|uniref:Putative zinc-finger domain-containing protein n=1 Tax=Bipolaris oryzae ATCC 44560 TaxID=930090 RepID=W6Z3C6_COCMI|nr:uncharacterized protein COCMIDRAFT_37946 [Bipolaris oryzae ATCC 44560]EUC44218.1 hypothetical protein COCMIDRAFT_37946 [Bipolaris oryzae ATCC 44560]
MPPPQGAPPEEQRGAPPLQQLPGINFNSYAHNSQQPPFPAPSWPPQQPPDANIWALFQNGAFPPPNLPPPPFPTMGFPPPSLPQTPQNIPPPTHFPQSLPQRPPHPPAPHQPPAPVPAPAPAPAFTTAPPPTNERIQGIMDSDREDGELSEGDMASHPPPPVHVNGGRPPTSAVQYNGQSHKTAVKQQENQPTLLEKLHQDRESARQFIKLLHSNNIPYRTLADEKLDAELLRGLYQSVNLPSEPAPILPPKPNGTTPSAPAVQPVAAPQQRTVPTLKTNAISAPSTKAAASPTTPGDRKDYIARLQAAKAAKQAASSKTSSPSQQITPAKPRTPQPISTPTTKPPVTDEQRARNTELIKQRLEAIKARQKASNGVSNNTTQASVPSQQTPQAQVAQPAPSGLATPSSQSYTPSFSGIPGLFMTHTPVSNNTASTPSQPSLSIPQKPPASKNEASISRESTTSYTRPLGQSANAHQEDDSMIIEVSDDESNGSDMDIEDEPPAPTGLPRKPGIPVRPAFPATLSDNAPGSQTPSTLARERELVDKEKQLVAMRETLKRKLAEKRERDRLASAAAVSSPTTQKPSTSVLAPQNSTPSKAPSTVGRDTARSRRAEIQSKLPTLDAEIASNTSRMAELAKELEQLTALNNKIAKDKEQLTKELELLGVDTEGMSHAELRAKKDEIEREQSPEPNVSSQNAEQSSRSLMTPSSLAVQPSLEPSSPKSSVPSSQPLSSQPFQKHVILPGLGQSIAQAQHQPQASMNQTDLHQRSETMSNGNEAAQTAEDEYTRASRSQSSVIASDRDMGEDFYSPAPPAEEDVAVQPAASNTDVTNTPAVTQPSAAPSPSEGEVEMSVSEGEDGEEEEEYEPEYDPEEHAAVGNASTEEPCDSQPNVAPSVTTSHVSAEEEEAYEPPEADQDMADVPNEATTSGSVPQALQTEADDGAMDIATSSDDSSDDSDSDEESESDSEADDTISGNNLAHQDSNVADDLAPELQPQIISVVDNVQPTPAPEEEEEPAVFKPYQSPLRMFKSYRYHPSYSKDVSGGFMSLTFSHQIDPEKPFCQYESAGGACNDPECPDQHFRDATITGDKLLLQLGTANPGKTSEERQRWNDGLRNVLKELRSKNVKDPNGIAEEIARYRREFLNDDTRVVNL